MRMRKVKKIKQEQDSCYTCAKLGWRNYMTSPYSGGVDYWCNKSGKDLSDPKDFICNDWGKRKGN